MKQTCTLCFGLLLFAFHFSNAQCSLSKPNASVSSWSSCDATLSWTTVANASYYKVRYKFKNGVGWNTLPDQITGLSYTFTNLIADSGYKFGVQAYCTNGSGSGWKNAQKTLDKVTIPTNLRNAGTAGTSITVAWDEHCPVLTYNLRYRVTGGSKWTTVNGLTALQYLLTGTTLNTSYDFQVQSLNAIATSKWTVTTAINSGDSITIPPPPPPTPTKPNIILYLLDDSRYDPFGPNGGPTWFTNPSISRVANEGINFVYSFPTTSQCAPSRVSFYSGLYASHHGAVDNQSRHYDNIPLVQQILHNAGYYTGFVGKYGQFQGDPVGFDWWATSDGNVYNNPPYKINGKDTSITGHISDVYQNLAMTFLNSVPQGKKFCLFFFTRVPHAPTIPRVQDTTLFKGNTMPFPDNFYRYTTNYPSYLYASGHNWTHDDAETDSVKLNEFQCLYGAEVNVSALFNWLTTKGILDSTMFIFSSDNGYLEGEHKLEAKQLAQEESIRIPMFIRWPGFFPAGEVNTDIMAFNIDIAPTLMDAADITDTFGMDGTSILKLYKGEIARKYFYYQFAGDGPTPPLRAIRSKQYKYVKTYCNQLTEEFYDLTTDPEENTNQINNASYASIIATYRTVLDSCKTALGDTDPAPVNCFLSNPQFSKEENEESDAYDVRNVEVYPNPASGYFTVYFNDEEREDIEVWITNLNDEKVYYKKITNANSFNMIVNAHDWAEGFYMVTVKKGNKTYNSKFTVQ